MIPSVVEWTRENKPYPDERSDQTGYQKLIDDGVCSVDEKTESDECSCKSEGIPIVYRKSSYPLWVGVPGDVFLSKFLIREVRIQHEPEKIPVDDEEKMKRQNHHLIREVCPSKKADVDDMIQKQYHQE